METLRRTMAQAKPGSTAAVMAADSILDRAGHKPVDRVESKTEIKHALDEVPEDRAAEAIVEAALASGKVARLK